MPLDMDMIRHIQKPDISGFSGVNISKSYPPLFSPGYPSVLVIYYKHRSYFEVRSIKFTAAVRAAFHQYRAAAARSLMNLYFEVRVRYLEVI